MRGDRGGPGGRRFGWRNTVPRKVWSKGKCCGIGMGQGQRGMGQGQGKGRRINFVDADKNGKH